MYLPETQSKRWLKLLFANTESIVRIQEGVGNVTRQRHFFTDWVLSRPSPKPAIKMYEYALLRNRNNRLWPQNTYTFTGDQIKSFHDLSRLKYVDIIVALL